MKTKKPKFKIGDAVQIKQEYVDWHCQEMPFLYGRMSHLTPIFPKKEWQMLARWLHYGISRKKLFGIVQDLNNGDVVKIHIYFDGESGTNIVEEYLDITDLKKPTKQPSVLGNLMKLHHKIENMSTKELVAILEEVEKK